MAELSRQLAPAGKGGPVSSFSFPAPHHTVSPLFPHFMSGCSLSGALGISQCYSVSQKKVKVFIVFFPPRLAFCGMVR